MRVGKKKEERYAERKANPDSNCSIVAAGGI